MLEKSVRFRTNIPFLELEQALRDSDRCFVHPIGSAQYKLKINK